MVPSGLPTVWNPEYSCMETYLLPTALAIRKPLTNRLEACKKPVSSRIKALSGHMEWCVKPYGSLEPAI